MQFQGRQKISIMTEHLAAARSNRRALELQRSSVKNSNLRN